MPLYLSSISGDFDLMLFKLVKRPGLGELCSERLLCISVNFSGTKKFYPGNIDV